MFSVKLPTKAESCESESHDCCSTQPKGKTECPLCHYKAKGVLTKTLEHLLINEIKDNLNCLDGFSYCKTASCEVVYFRDNEILTQKDLSVIVGLKEGVSPATVCYCFSWTKEKIEAELKETGKTKALKDIQEKMKDPGCACEILNPSGGCCLGDVGKAIKVLETKIAI